MIHTGDTYSPIGDMSSYQCFMRDLKFPKTSMDKIMCKNAAELFRIDLGTAAEDGEKQPTIIESEVAMKSVDTSS